MPMPIADAIERIREPRPFGIMFDTFGKRGEPVFVVNIAAINSLDFLCKVKREYPGVAIELWFEDKTSATRRRKYRR